MYAWGKKGKMLVFTGVYVCVRAKLTLVSFFLVFSLFFFCTFPLGHLTWLETLISFSGFPAPLSTVPCRVANCCNTSSVLWLKIWFQNWEFTGRMETKRSVTLPGARYPPTLPWSPCRTVSPLCTSPQPRSSLPPADLCWSPAKLRCVDHLQSLGERVKCQNLIPASPPGEVETTSSPVGN